MSTHPAPVRRIQIDLTDNPHQWQAIQLLQSSESKFNLCYGPSGSTKSWTIMFVTFLRAMSAPGSRHVVFRDTRTNCQQTLFDKTLHEVIDKAFPWLRNEAGFNINLSDLSVSLPTSQGKASTIFFSGLDENRADKVLGDEFATVWFNECNAFSYAQVSKLLTRLRQRAVMLDGTSILKNKMFFDCNPRWFTDWDFRAFIERINPATGDAWPEPEQWQCLFMDSLHNIKNLSAGYREDLLLGSREDVQRYFVGYWSNSSTNSLFTPQRINDSRIAKPKINGRDMTVEETKVWLVEQDIILSRIIVQTDPATTNNKNSDSSGIVVLGIDDRQEQEHVYVLADETVKDVPAVVCQTVIRAYKEWGASMIFFENNQGGLWLDAAMRKEWQNAPVRFNTATKMTGGKAARAEPVSAQYARGVIHHVGSFPKLEEQMTQYGNKGANGSPDRMDALVWGVWELLELQGGKKVVPGMRQGRGSGRRQ